MCLRALDSKHIRIQEPLNSGTVTYNYKHDHSINLLAVCDAGIKFRMIYIGQTGCWSDARVFEHSTFGKASLDGKYTLPTDQYISSWPDKLSYYIVADEAFSLKTWRTLAVI